MTTDRTASAPKGTWGRLMNMGLLGKSFVLSMAPILFMGITMAIVFFQIVALNDKVEHMISNAVPALTTSAEIRLQLERFESLWWRGLANHGNKEELKSIAAGISDMVQRMGEIRERYTGYGPANKADPLRSKAFQEWTRLEPGVLRISEIFTRDELSGARAYYESQVAPKLAGLRETIKGISLSDTALIDSYRDSTTAGAQATTVFGSLIAILLSGMLTQIIARRMVGRFTSLTETLSYQTVITRESSEVLREAAHQIRSTAESSSAAVVQTSAAIDQMRAMMQRTDDNVKDSTKISESSVKQLQSGQQSIAEVRERFRDVQRAISEMSGALEMNTRNLMEILGIMNEISAKALMINDVVFRTKLLSFNASVEASRAGSHGKGFAVVAEEIGSLAASSQIQGDEIAQLLSKGREQISSLIEESNHRLKAVEDRIQSVMRESDFAVDNGIQIIDTAMELGRQVDKLLADIASAINEQFRGSTEILNATKVLNEMSANTIQLGNKLTSGSAVSLRQAEDLSVAADHLKLIVRGAS